MQGTRRLLARLWTDARGVASVEYVMLLAIISGGIIMGLTYLGDEVSDGLSEAATWLGDAGDAGDNNCGNEGGAGQGGGNTC